MLRLHRLEVEDFGPYKGSQEFCFPRGAGVAVVYGENRRGKTSLLNAIRYALLGQVVTRGSRPLQFHKVLNTVARAEGRRSFRVSLEFEFDGHAYVLTRRCEMRAGIAEPASNEDFKTALFLQRDGQALSSAETGLELGRIMPPQVARFFLFDGELLSEYEELLRDQGESDVGPRIAAAIEQILGLPVLQNARADLEDLAERAEQEESKAAQRDKATQAIGAVLANLTSQLQKQRSELARLTQDLADASARKADLEEVLAKSAALGALVTERDRVDRDIVDLSERAEHKRAKLQEAMQSAWRGPLARRLEPLRLKLEQRRDALQARIAEQIAAAQRAQEFHAAAMSGKCPVCAQEVESAEMERLAALAEGGAGADVAADQMAVVRVQQELDTLARLASGDDLARVTDLFEDLEAVRVKLHSQKNRLRELTEEIADYNESDYRLQRKEFEQTLGQVQILQRGIDAQTVEVAKTEAQLKDSRKQLDRISGAGLAGERRKREMFVALAEIFREAVAVYRNRLRGRVEKDATALFLKLTSEPDDAGLRINDQYGLTIVHNDGTDIVVRSSGAEQIVALSLMGALQKNAPLRGPIIADSLLMRVDDTHRANLVRALPSMSEQVVVFVFRAEMKPQDARTLLNGDLLAEYQLTRVSAKHTRIEPYRGNS